MEEADDLLLISYPLPLERVYVGEESSYREAVEYQVLYRLTLIRGELEPPLKLISENRYNTRAAAPIVEKYAAAIVDDFRRNYPYFPTPSPSSGAPTISYEAVPGLNL